MFHMDKAGVLKKYGLFDEHCRGVPCCLEMHQNLKPCISIEMQKCVVALAVRSMAQTT